MTPEQASSDALGILGLIRRQWKWIGIVGAAGLSTAVVWCYKDMWTTGPEDRLSRERGQGYQQLPITGSNLKDELLHHYYTVQRVVDTTTLPQLLAELHLHLGREAGISSLVTSLRVPDTSSEERQQLWRELTERAFAKAVAATWLIPLLAVMLRVQLNILGRHLFAERMLRSPSHVPVSETDTFEGFDSPQTSKLTQIHFLDYIHYLPECVAGRIFQQLRRQCGRLFNDLKLVEHCSISEALHCLSTLNADFEVSVESSDGGWAAMLLPSLEDRAAYFAAFKEASPLDRPGTLQQEAVQGLVDEFTVVAKSKLFLAALKASVAASARQLAFALEGELGEDRWPMVKVVPRLSTASESLLSQQSSVQISTLRIIAALPAVQELCAYVYSACPIP